MDDRFLSLALAKGLTFVRRDSWKSEKTADAGAMLPGATICSVTASLSHECVVELRVRTGG